MAYKRIVIKISGEALLGESGKVYDERILKDISSQIAHILSTGIQVGLVIGAGNIWRGRMDAQMNHCTADNMGMMATLINALCMSDYIGRCGGKAKVLSAISVDKVSELFTFDRAEEAFKNGNAVVFACGLGNPFFTTDTAAALRACEIGADAVFFAKNIDGVYDSDPRTNKNAKRIKTISYQDILSRDIKFIDQTAAILLRDNNIDSVAFYLNEKDGIKNAVCNASYGSLIKNNITTTLY